MFSRHAAASGKTAAISVLGRGGLQLEVELPAEALAERQRPRLVDAAAERRVQDELHAARLVEETFADERLLRRDGAERAVTLLEVGGHLFGAGAAEADLGIEPRGKLRPDRSSRGG
jgi:hypothetical protein